MYNRYIRDEWGGHRRVSQWEPEVPPPPADDPPSPPPAFEQPPPPPPMPPPSPAPPPPPDLRLFDKVLESLHLGELDSGDLLLLLILFLLFRQDADEEILIALGLLLIL